MQKHFLVALFLLLAIAPTANAQQFHVGIEPTSIYIDATPPSNVQAPFLLKNLSGRNVELKPKLIPFEPDMNGKVKLLINEGQNLDSIIRERLTIIDENEAIGSIHLTPGETKQLRLFLELKPGDPVGDYYFSLVFMAEGNELDQTSTSSIPAGITTNVMLSIGPKEPPSASIQEFSTNSFTTKGPVAFSLKVENNGNHLIQPKGTIAIKNMLGKEVGRLEILPQYLLANSSRLLIDSNQASPSAQIDSFIQDLELTQPAAIWGEKFLFGFYTAEARLTFDNSNEPISQKTQFLAIPLQVIFFLSGVIFITLGILLRVKLRIRRKNTP